MTMTIGVWQDRTNRSGARLTASKTKPTNPTKCLIKYTHGFKPETPQQYKQASPLKLYNLFLMGDLRRSSLGPVSQTTTANHAARLGPTHPQRARCMLGPVGKEVCHFQDIPCISETGCSLLQCTERVAPDDSQAKGSLY